MLNRIDAEKKEYITLSKFATKAAESKGRVVDEEACDIRTDFQRDRDRIIHSKAFRRLMHKTQVFLAPEKDHFRTRLTHTLEVSQISKTIARALELNEDLTEAIALGHDLGHTPFGHNGEEFLNEKHILESGRGFKHNLQSLRVVDVLEGTENRKGMNLTREVRDGIVNHTGKGIPFTLEGQIVKICDRVAYINHDIDDALRSGVINKKDLPKESVEVLGYSTRERIDSLVSDLIANSDNKNTILQGPSCEVAMNVLRNFMFENVYHSPIVKKDEELEKVRNIIFALYDFYLENMDFLPTEYKDLAGKWDSYELVKDHIAGMTDRYAINQYIELFVPNAREK